MLTRYLGTRRDPSAFELPSSTAPASLGGGQRSDGPFFVTQTGPDPGDWRPPSQRSRPPVRPTTKLCLLHLEGVEDAYEPGTLPDRAYRRNPLVQQGRNC
jgi:hypothetical protein